MANIYNNYVSSLSPVLWYKLNESSGNLASSGSLAASLDGSGSYLTYNQFGPADGKSCTLPLTGGSGTWPQFTTGSSYQFPTNTFNDRTFTIAAWIKLSTVTDGAGDRMIATFRDGSSGNETIYLAVSTYNSGGNNYAGKPFLSYEKSGSTTNYAVSASAARVDNNVWNHVAATFNGTSVTMYINGISQFSTTFTGIPSTFVLDQNSNVTTYLGANQAGFRFGGNIDDLTLFGSVLTATQIANLAQSVPVYRFSLEETSGTSAANTGRLIFNSNIGGTPNLAQSGVSGNCIYFDGVNDEVSHYIADVTASTFPTNTFNDRTHTREFWFKTNGQIATSEHQIMVSQDAFGQGPEVLNIAISGTLVSADRGKVFAEFVDGANYASITSTNRYDDSKWHHVVVTQNSTTATLYIDGSSVASGTISGTTFPNWNIDNNTNQSFWIGKGAYYSSGWTSGLNFKGWIDEVNIYGKALSATEALNQYNEVQLSVSNTADPSTASARFQEPAILAEAATASALMVQPAFNSTVEYPAQSMGATADVSISAPTISTQKSVSVPGNTATVSAEFHMPQTQIGTVRTVENMSASALMLASFKLDDGSSADAMTVSAEIVQPTIQSQSRLIQNAQPMRANAASLTPPAYISLLDDKWYALLSDQTASKYGMPSGLNHTLKMFGDITQNIYYPGTGTPLPMVTQRTQYTGGTTTPAPRFEYSYFDGADRKAIRVLNAVAGTWPGDVTNTKDRTFSFEMIFKTNKSNQIIASGWDNGDPTSVSSRGSTSTIGIYNGKLYTAGQAYSGQSFQNIHPLNTAALSTGIWTYGNKRIDDGQWHHIVIQYGENPTRMQFWIDGELDVQKYNYGFHMPSVYGFNTSNSTYSSDFYISGVSITGNYFVNSTEILKHYLASINYTPVSAEPMVASITATPENKARGNRARALMLYWWPINGQFLGSEHDAGQNGEFDHETFSDILTIDYLQDPPAKYFGWDIFPVDINGYYVSELVKPEAYTSIIKTTLGGYNPSSQQKEFLINGGGYFRDPVTDNRRYIDLINDIDLSQFDAIFFRNYPDQSAELDDFTRNEIVDGYFGTVEKDLYEKFIKSLRAAVKTGISLYISNTQLALDLGIVDRIDTLPSLAESNANTYSPTIAPTVKPINMPYRYWTDTHHNNFMTIKNTLTGLTDLPGVIHKDMVFWENDDSFDFGGIDHESHKYEYKANGLGVGDTFYLSDANIKYSKPYQASHISNVKAGKVITTFAPTIINNGQSVTNPHKDYALHIAVSPDDMLQGEQAGGKIFVSFTELFPSRRAFLNSPFYNFESTDHAIVELIQDKWINLAYEQGFITLAKRNELLNAPFNIDRKIENGQLPSNTVLKYWDLNGDNVLAQRSASTSYIQLDQNASQSQESLNKNNVSADGPGGYVKEIFFTFKYSRLYPTAVIEAPSMSTRGFWWLSQRIVPEGTVLRTAGLEASAVILQPTVVADKIISANAQAMIGSAKINEAQGYSPKDSSIAPLPFMANATITQYTKNVNAAPMTASALSPSIASLLISSVDEIVLYIEHTDPILYLREEVIK